ncbi:MULTISPECIES: hypothetical protein [unclassified Bradyrhizobium]
MASARGGGLVLRRGRSALTVSWMSGWPVRTRFSTWTRELVEPRRTSCAGGPQFPVGEFWCDRKMVARMQRHGFIDVSEFSLKTMKLTAHTREPPFNRRLLIMSTAASKKLPHGESGNIRFGRAVLRGGRGKTCGEAVIEIDALIL